MDDLFTLFTARFAEAGIDVVITGGVAAVVYGQPRLTHDIDLIADLGDGAVDALDRAFPVAQFLRPPVELIGIEAGREQRGHFTIIDRETGFRADVYAVGRDRLARWALAGRRHVPFGEHTLGVAPPEYIIVRKLEHYREGGNPRHLNDIRAILVHCTDDLDPVELEARIAELGLDPEWEQVAPG